MYMMIDYIREKKKERESNIFINKMYKKVQSPKSLLHFATEITGAT